MLLKFSVENFKSFKDTQEIDFYATSSKNKEESNIFVGSVKNKPIRLVNTGIIIGPNASGKSNLVDAINIMAMYVMTSATNKDIIDGDIPYEPFMLDIGTQKEPSEFEIIFTMEGVTFQYGFTLDSKGVVTEWLNAYPNGRLQCWFYRKSNRNDECEVVVSPSLRMPKRRKLNLIESTRRSSLILSVANMLNMKEFDLPFRWFHEKLVVVSSASEQDRRFPESFRDYSQIRCINDDTIRNNVLGLLKAADTGVSDIFIEKKQFTLDELQDLDYPVDIDENEDLSIEKLLQKEFKRVRFQHCNIESGVTTVFKQSQESTGTLDLFDLGGPLCDILLNGKVLVIDELGSALHPDIVALILDMFHNKKTNPQNAQLLFTSHAHTLLMKDILRRDQIWITQKNNDQSTKITPLSSFHPRANEAIMRGYYLGRYEGLPITSKYKPVFDEIEEERKFQEKE